MCFDSFKKHVKQKHADAAAGSGTVSEATRIVALEMNAADIASFFVNRNDSNKVCAIIVTYT